MSYFCPHCCEFLHPERDFLRCDLMKSFAFSDDYNPAFNVGYYKKSLWIFNLMYRDCEDKDKFSSACKYLFSRRNWMFWILEGKEFFEKIAKFLDIYSSSSRKRKSNELEVAELLAMVPEEK